MNQFRIGKFQVIGTLGTGAHSTILHIRRSADAKHYALKVVPIDGAADMNITWDLFNSGSPRLTQFAQPSAASAVAFSTIPARIRG